MLLSESDPQRVSDLLAALAERGPSFHDNADPTDPAVSTGQLARAAKADERVAESGRDPYRARSPVRPCTS
ncbi:hypothetical protein [Streptomyces sp. KLOTTS4A1]|uniref:hypothetical protein n=1 Tax=Streptomyces sp. KLOTTS4A1 TaxID=3390996 RepID=UPI0039F5A743